MYYSMNTIGDDTAEKLKALSGADEKWNCITEMAGSIGVSGLQISPKYPNEYGLPLDTIPAFIKDSFRLTCHHGTLYHLCEKDDIDAFHSMMEYCLNIAGNAEMEDVSIHPPLLANVTLDPDLHFLEVPDRREETRNHLQECLAEWMPRFREYGITLSMESHVTSSLFVFTDMADYHDLLSDMQEIGALVDVSHNFFDGYNIPDILAELQDIRITGFHISDAIQGVPLREGTHLTVGRGHIFFRPLSEAFGENDPCVAFEIRGPSENTRNSIHYLRQLW